MKDVNNDLNDFIENFDIVENALKMRDLLRWNGRDINKENLSEHTHLATACLISLYDELPDEIKSKINFKAMIKGVMMHDSLELLRGDILSVTKDRFPELRNLITSEEHKFMKALNENISEIELDLINLADLKSCYEFVKFELRYPSNDFALNVYNDAKSKFDVQYQQFCKKYDIEFSSHDDNFEVKLSKGYNCDAGIDIVINKRMVFMPHKTSTEILDLSVTPDEGEMAMLISRSSAAIKGLYVANCPIDSNYNGKISAIVTNNSNDILIYEKGDSFCQIVFVPVNYKDLGQTVKKSGIRSDGKFGSTL